MSGTEKISIVIGSWGSYNACNERALGSNWIDLTEYESWEDIEEELKKQGFELDGIDEELFVQDIENLPSDGANWDYVSPKKLFNVLKESEVLENGYKYDLMAAFLEVRSLDEFFELVESQGSHWDDDINLYKDMDWYDLGYYFIHEVNCNEVPDWLDNYIDYSRYGEELSYDGFSQYANGIIEIR